MVRAIPVPKSVFNPTTGQWEAPMVDLTPPKKNKGAYKPPTHVVFSGEKGSLSAPYWGDCRGKIPKSWKYQSKRQKQCRKMV